MKHLFLIARPVRQRIAGYKSLDRSSTWPDHAPNTWQESAVITARTIRYTCGETLGKWPLKDIVFGIKYHMKCQGLMQLEYVGKRSVELKGREILAESIYLLKYLKLCFYFSKKPFCEFLLYGGYSEVNVLFQNSKAKLLRPAFTIVADKNSNSFLIIIRGATSSRDRLTAATSGEVPFQKLNLHEGGIANSVNGHVHCGIVASARWIAKYAVPCLHKAKENFPNYEIKIMGHSMGAGVAAILTHILRERKEFSSCTCLAFAPAACMTWDLAESGKKFVTSLVNRTDMVPSFSKVSADNLRTKVVGPSQRNELKDKMLKIPLNAFYKAFNQNLNFLQSCLLLISGSQSKITNADMALYHEPGISQSRTGTHSSQSRSSRKDLKFADSRYFTTSRRNPRIVTKRKKTELHLGPPLNDNKQLYPPGRIIHMVSCTEGKFGIYETPRDLYGKLRLAPNMIRDHYMPKYIETLESLIDKLGRQKLDTKKF